MNVGVMILLYVFFGLCAVSLIVKCRESIKMRNEFNRLTNDYLFLLTEMYDYVGRANCDGVQCDEWEWLMEWANDVMNNMYKMADVLKESGYHKLADRLNYQGDFLDEKMTEFETALYAMRK